MAYQLSFDVKQRYISSESGITVEAILHSGQKTANCLAKIDTGAQLCLFERAAGELLGLEIEKGMPIELSTLTGTMLAYGFEITMEVLGLEFVSTVYFPQSSHIHRNILGRQGFLQLLKFGLVDYDSELYLSSY